MKLKKLTALCLSAAMILGGTTVFAQKDITVKLDEEVLNFDVPATIINDRTMVPMRGIFEKLNFTVEWNSAEKSINASGPADVYMQIGNNKMLVNGTEFEMDTPPQIVDSRTLIPLRALTESIGCSVDWDKETRTVIIASKAEENVSLEGTWVSETVNMADGFAEAFDANFDSDLSIRNYLPDMLQTATITFGENGIYTADVVLDADVETFRANLAKYLGDVFALENGGVPLTDKEIKEIFGKDLESVAAELTTDADIEFLFGDEHFTGSYSLKDEVITLDEGKEEETTGTFNGKTLIIDWVDMGSVKFTKK